MSVIPLSVRCVLRVLLLVTLYVVKALIFPTCRADLLIDPFMRDLDLCERNGFRCDSLISAVELDCANPGCEGVDRNCKLSACWELTPDRKAYTFHMRVNGAEWGGIGFNERQLMTGTDLYWLGKEDGAPVVKSLYASETNIPKPHTGSDGKEVTGEPYVNVLSAVSYDNDYLEASWTVPIKVSQSDRDGSRTRADLAKGNELFAIFAVGKGAWPVFQYHSDKGTTSQKVDIFRQGDPAVAEAIAVNSGSMISTGKAAHGILMIVAWVVLSPLATFTARYLKFAGPIWFRSHRNMQVVAYVLTIVALIIIVLELNAEGKDFSTLTDNPEAGGYSKTHGSLGLAVIGMSSLQVLLGIFRNQISGFDAKEQHDDPNYHGPRRYIFNYAHWFNGWSLLAISITTVYFGLNTSCCGVDIPATDVLLTFIGLAVGPIVLAMECFRRGQNAEENENTMAKHVFALACAASVATGVTIIVIIVNGTAPAK